MKGERETYPNAIHAVGEFASELCVLGPKLGLVILSVGVLHLAQDLGAVGFLVVFVAIGVHGTAAEPSVALASLPPPR